VSSATSHVRYYFKIAVRCNLCFFLSVIHPPIIIENLLPCSGIFELVTENQRRVLWSSNIEACTACHIHTVSLEEPILLLVDLSFCRSDEGVMVHKPDSKSLPELASVMLSDSVGQRLRLGLENILGGGGQRRLNIYCPFWVVNASQYCIRLKEEGGTFLPAGTQRSQRCPTYYYENV